MERELSEKQGFNNVRSREDNEKQVQSDTVKHDKMRDLWFNRRKYGSYTPFFGAKRTVVEL